MKEIDSIIELEPKVHQKKKKKAISQEKGACKRVSDYAF